jgi:hypothetical protein
MQQITTKQRLQQQLLGAFAASCSKPEQPKAFWQWHFEGHTSA